jgi:aspartate kinase
MKILVQKFGGTSVRTPEARQAAIGKVTKALADGYTVAVVVSAMGRVGEPYATDTLLQLLHTSNPDVAGHETDMLLCCGEIISACVFAAELQRAGFPAMAMTGGQAGIETDDTYGSAHLLRVDPRPAMKVMAQGIIPVICGFQGATRPDGQMTTLGRGGSDTSAAALGVGLKASAVEIYTDVDGIMTADPRMVDHPRIMSQISYGACCELAEQGARVIHQRAVEIAQEGNIPLYVKCTFDDTPGTLITNVGRVAERVSVEPRSFVNGITYIKDLTQYRVTLNGAKAGQALFQALADAGISVSCLNLSLTESMFSVFSDKAKACAAVLKANGFPFQQNDRCAKVSVVGISVRGMPGLMASFVNALNEKGIEILQTVDSNTSISAIIKEKALKEAVVSLHEAYGLNQ